MINIRTQNTDIDEKFWKYGVSAFWMALCAHILFMGFFYFYNVFEMVIFNLFSISLFSILLYIIKLKKYNLILSLVYLEVTFHAVFATYYIGVTSGFYYYFFTLVIITLIVRQESIKNHMFKSILYMAVFFLFEIVFSSLTPVYLIDKDVLLVVRYLNLLGLLAFSIPFMYYLMKTDLDKSNLLYSYATKDQLTGLYNRRYVDSIVEHEFLNKNYNSLVIVLADIDFFKKINDNYGHHCGDYVLATVSKILQSCVRKEDTLSRWGGEEFLFFMPNSTTKDAKYLVKRVQDKINSLILECDDTKDIKITLTFGVAQNKEDETFSDLLARADIALYDGKLAGRDRIVISGEDAEV